MFATSAGIVLTNMKVQVHTVHEKMSMHPHRPYFQNFWEFAEFICHAL
jgi:hypothetical protein